MNHQEFAQKMSVYSILYVEDDPQIRRYISEFLKRYCKTIYTSDNSEEAKTLYHKHHPDILLLDINLPGQNGIEFASYIRERDQETRILISTAYTNKEFMLRAVELSLTRYLVKPVTSDELIEALQKCLGELSSSDLFVLGEGYLYNRSQSAVFNDKEKVVLRKKEAEILEYFIAHEGEVVRYEVLETILWSQSVMTRDAIRSQIRNIRKKIPISLFKNISGIGYKFKSLD
ncbi:MAG: response regulator transcription factor [Epsilonproteobacteria bacterium]|nr:response regulator transcription factor [Campylobacterota bacterium]